MSARDECGRFVLISEASERCVMSTPHELMGERFGWSSFRPGQDEVIGHLLADKSAAAVFPNGGGKSLCYQLPALLLPRPRQFALSNQRPANSDAICSGNASLIST